LKSLPRILLFGLAGLFAGAITFSLRLGATDWFEIMLLSMFGGPYLLLVTLGASLAGALLGFEIGAGLEKVCKTFIPLRIAASAAMAIGFGMAVGYGASRIIAQVSGWGG